MRRFDDVVTLVPSSRSRGSNLEASSAYGYQTSPTFVKPGRSAKSEELITGQIVRIESPLLRAV
jgi:hypothetical protein